MSDVVQEIVDLAFPTSGVEGPNAWTDERIRERTRFAANVHRILDAVSPPTAEPPATALDVERLARAMATLRWEWLGWTDRRDNLPGRADRAFRNQAEKIAAAYATPEQSDD